MTAGKPEIPREGNLYLLGFMGAGKSTVGRLLAETLRRPFFDTDRLVAEREGRPIPQIFAESGEAYFREVEADVVREVTEKERAVVALGGGAVVRESNWRAVSASGTTVFLQCDLQTLLDRLVRTDDRPLLGNDDLASRRERIARLLREREPLYARADFTVGCSGLPPQEVVQRILGWLG